MLISSKKGDFDKAFWKFERVADRLINEGERSEIFHTPESLAVKKFIDQTESEFYEEMRKARIENTMLAFDTMLRRRVEAYSAERKAKRGKKCCSTGTSTRLYRSVWATSCQIGLVD